MTLDFKKLIRNAVKKQMSIQHFESNVQIFKDDELPESVRQKIAGTYGNDFLADANYTLWFSGQGFTKEIIQKTIFKIANKSLGEAANDMNEADLKTIDLGSGSGSADVPAETPDDVETMTDASAEAANDEAIGELVGTDDADDDADEADDLDESVESPAAGEKFVFLKITMK